MLGTIYAMPSTKKRLYLTLSARLEGMLKAIAKRDALSVATVATNLLERALDIEEDDYLLLTAHEREKTKTVYLAHRNVW